MIKRVCLNCGREFSTKESRLKSGRGKFCSRSCNSSFQHRGKPKPKSRLNILKAIETHKGQKPWNWNMATLTCQQCDKSFQVGNARKDRAKFCSRECSHKYKTTIRGTSHPLWKRQLRKCEWCSKEVWVKPAKLKEFRFCSRECLGAWVKSHCHRPSTPEKIVANAFDILKIPYEMEYKIGKYPCDFALPQLKIVIEVDGTYWHSLPKQIIKDKTKDRFLRQQGWKIIRFKEADIHSNLTKCLIKISHQIHFI